jgi:hypothetical protein
MATTPFGTSPRKSVTTELVAIGLAALLFVATFRVRPPYVDLALAAAAVALIAASAGRSRRLWAMAPAAAVGTHRDAWRVCALFTVAALVALAIAAIIATGTGTPWQQRFSNWHLLIAAALYFPWALLQQYIFQFYLLGRCLRLVATPLAIVLTASAFAAVHFPRWPVMIVTLIAGTVWSVCYYRWRRLLPLALSHAVLGAALHYWVFGRDLLDAWLTR